MGKELFVNDDGSLKPWLTYSVLALAVLVGGYFVYAAWTGTGGELKATLMCSTPGCGRLRVEALEVGEMIPAKCPKCEKETMLPAFHCPNCKAVNIWNENRGLPPPTKCSKCGQEVRHGS